jgi:hypothetical protein
MKKIYILMVTLSFVLTITLFGQDLSGGRIYAAQGNDFVILRDGTRILYYANRLNEEPVAFLQGDIFQTGQQSSADIQFGANGPLLKIVENSSIRFVGYGSGLSVLALDLFYGRIRARNVGSGYAVHVNSENGMVEITQGDTGVDYIVRNDLITLQSGNAVSSPVLYVSNFAGETSVYPSNDGNAVSTLPQLLVREGETVSVEFVSSLSYVERNTLESTTTDYWQTYDFAPIPPSPSLITEAPTPAVVPPQTVPPANTAPQNDALASEDESIVSTNVEEIPYALPSLIPEYETIIQRKNNAFLAGLIFLAGGLALGGVGMYYQYLGNNSSRSVGYYLTLSGMVVAGIGTASFIYGLTIQLE